jgi:heme-degrading monooxygenase HmoA
MFFSSTKTIGEVMQQIWQKYYSTVEESRGFRENTALRGVKSDDLVLVLSTADAPQWHHWDRNWALRDCLANYEDIAVSATTVESVMRNQDELSAARAQAAAAAAEAAARAAAEAEANKPKVKNYTFTKGQLAWYYKVSAEETAALSIAEMVETQPMIMVGLHISSHISSPWAYCNALLLCHPLWYR